MSFKAVDTITAISGLGIAVILGIIGFHQADFSNEVANTSKQVAEAGNSIALSANTLSGIGIMDGRNFASQKEEYAKFKSQLDQARKRKQPIDSLLIEDIIESMVSWKPYPGVSYTRSQIQMSDWVGSHAKGNLLAYLINHFDREDEIYSQLMSYGTFDQAIIEAKRLNGEGTIVDCNLKGAIIKSSEISNLNFFPALLDQVYCENTGFNGCEFAFGTFHHTVLMGGVSVNRPTIGEKAYFNGSAFWSCEFDSTRFESIGFKDCTFKGSIILNGTGFSNCDMENVNCYELDTLSLINSDLSGLRLDKGAKFKLSTYIEIDSATKASLPSEVYICYLNALKRSMRAPNDLL